MKGIDLFVKILSHGKAGRRKISILRSASASILHLKIHLSFLYSKGTPIWKSVFFQLEKHPLIFFQLSWVPNIYVSYMKSIATYALTFFGYRIVASTNTCYYSENQIFGFLKSRIVTWRFFFRKKIFCLSLELLDIPAVFVK